MLSLHVLTHANDGKLEFLLTSVAGHFDAIRICDGGCSTATRGVCSSHEVSYYPHPWRDDLSAQWNYLLEQAQVGEWILHMDDDEVPSVPLLKQLRGLVEESNRGEAFDLVQIPGLLCRDGQLEEPLDSRIQRIRDGLEVFYKENFFLYDGEVRFTGNAHSGVGHVKLWKRKPVIPEPYIHYKDSEEFVRGWVLWSYIHHCKPGVLDWDWADTASVRVLAVLKNRLGNLPMREFDAYLKAGQVDLDLKSVMISWRHDPNTSKKAFFWYYFLLLHPEELTEYPSVLGSLNSDPSVTDFLYHMRGPDATGDLTPDVIASLQIPTELKAFLI